MDYCDLLIGMMPDSLITFKTCIRLLIKFFLTPGMKAYLENIIKRWFGRNKDISKAINGNEIKEYGNREAVVQQSFTYSINKEKHSRFFCHQGRERAGFGFTGAFDHTLRRSGKIRLVVDYSFHRGVD